MSLTEIREYTNGVAHFADAHDASNEHNVVFGSLVTGDNDIIGLVAYSIYKQNKHDWLVAFNKANSRAPNEAETNAYIIGESTPRRLTIYRHLAEATLDGRGPSTAAGAEGLAQRSYAVAARHAREAASPSRYNWSLIGLVGLGVVAAIGVVLAMRYGFTR
jgi:hypothetical protein